MRAGGHSRERVKQNVGVIRAHGISDGIHRAQHGANIGAVLLANSLFFWVLTEVDWQPLL